MATDTQAPATAADAGLITYRITARQLARMCADGIIPKLPRCELLGGRLVQKMTKYPPHNYAVAKLGDLFRPILPVGRISWSETPILLNRFWRPEPDFTVVRGGRDEYKAREILGEDIGLIVEVSDSSYAKDRGIMWRRYAASRIEIYWIVNIPARRVEVYTNPSGRGKASQFAEAVMYADAAEVPVVVEGREVGRVAVRDLLA